MDQETIKNAEARVADLQSALDDAQRVLQAAEHAQQTVEESVPVIRRLALLALVGLVLVAVGAAVRGRTS